MRIVAVDKQTLEVSGLEELTAPNAGQTRNAIRAALSADHRRVDLDLSLVRMIDSSGLGALISVQKTMQDRKGVLRIVHPSAHVRQALELSRLHRVFELVL